VEQIRQLRAEKTSLAKIAAQTGTTVASVRRVVGKINHLSDRERQAEIAQRIDVETLSWADKAARWKAETGHCETTFWRILKRIRGSRVSDQISESCGSSDAANE